MISNYALISAQTNEVVNTIVADSTYAYEGYYLIEIAENILCQEGMFYNKKDMEFYYDSNFSHVGN